MNPGLPQPGSVALDKSVLYAMPCGGLGMMVSVGALSPDIGNPVT